MLTEAIHKGIRCYTTPEGKFYPSVSAVLDVVYPKKGQYIQADDMEDGSLSHEAIASILREGCAAIAPAQVARVGRLTEWIGLQQIRAVYIEEAFVHPVHGYAGKVDFVGEMPASQALHVFDWKFAEALLSRYRMQVEAYAGLLSLSTMRYLVQIPKSGPIRPKPLEPNPYLLAVFLSALNVVKYQLEN